MKKTLLCAALSLAALAASAQTADQALAAARVQSNWSGASGSYSGDGKTMHGTENGTAKYPLTFFENYTTNPVAGNVMTFSTGLNNGDYMVNLSVNCHEAWRTCAASEGDKTFHAIDVNGYSMPVPVHKSGSLDIGGHFNYDTYSIPANVTDGKLTITLKNLKSNGGNWCTVYVNAIYPVESNILYSQDFSANLFGFFSNTNAYNRALKSATAADNPFKSQAFENWNQNAYTGKMYNKTYVPNGKYKVSLDIKTGSTTGTYFYVNNQKTPIINDQVNSYSTEVDVTDGLIEFGLSIETAGPTWNLVDNAKIMRVVAVSIADANAALNNPNFANVTGSERTALQNAVDAADFTAIETAYNAFTAAADGYNAFVAAKNALTPVNIEYASAAVKGDVANMLAFAPSTAAEAQAKATEATALIATAKFSNARAEGSAFNVKPTIVNPNAANKDNNGWTNNVEVYNGTWTYKWESNEAPDSKWGVTNYFDYYGSKYAGTFHQTVACEPGVYRLAAFMRGSENGFTEYSLQATAGKSILAPVTELVKTNAKTIGNTGGYFGNGWDIYYVDVVVPTNSVSIATKVVCDADWKWLGFSNFTLVKIADITPEQNAAYAAQITPAAQEALNAAQYANVTGSERKALEDAIAANDVLAIESSLPTFTAAKGSYDAFANYKASVETKAATFEFATEDKKQTLDNALALMPATAAEAAGAVQPAKDAFIAALLSDMVYEGVASREEIAVVNPIPNTDGTFAGWTDEPFPGSANNAAMGMKNDQAISGAVDMPRYFDTNRWNDANFGTNFTQHFPFLNMGKYRLSAIMRGTDKGFDVYRLAAAADSILPTDGTAPSVSVDVKAEALLPNGFNPYFVEFDVPVNGPVTIGVQALSNGVNKWLSFGNVRLVKFDKTTTGVETVATEAEAAEYFDLNGRRVNAANLAHGIYIVRQGNKVSKVIR